MKKLAVLFMISVLIACSTDDEPGTDAASDTFDREAMLAHWADDIIIPAYQAYATQLDQLQTATATFAEAPDEAQLQDLRTAWLAAYRAWQSVSMFEIGPAEAVRLRSFTNIYPTDAEAIEENISDKNYTLDLPSKTDEQGFPALDYLLYGLGTTDADIVARYTQNDAYRTYLTAVVARLAALTTQVVDEWTGSYRASFVSNGGSSATGAVNKLVNDYLFYYEKALRAGKVGIPAGVFSSQPLPETVEGYYAGDVSKTLFLDALNATQDFFNGRSFGQENSGPGLRSYVDYLEGEGQENGEGLGARISNQFNEARTVAEGLSDNFAGQVIADNQAMLATYDALQKNVVLMKVDMFQTLNIKVDFVDADGD